MGEYMSKPAEANQRVLAAWLARLELVGLEIDEALRAMVLRTRLPGEAQQIDRSLPTPFLFHPALTLPGVIIQSHEATFRTP